MHTLLKTHDLQRAEFSIQDAWSDKLLWMFCAMANQAVQPGASSRPSCWKSLLHISWDVHWANEPLRKLLVTCSALQSHATALGLQASLWWFGCSMTLNNC